MLRLQPVVISEDVAVNNCKIRCCSAYRQKAHSSSDCNLSHVDITRFVILQLDDQQDNYQQSDGTLRARDNICRLTASIRYDLACAARCLP